MKKTFLALMFVALPVFAGPVDNMASSCKDVMDSGLCRVALDPRDYPNATIPIILPSGVRRISTSMYLSIRATGFAKDGNGNWLMCMDVLESCGKNGENWESDRCLTHRSLWRQ